MKKFTRLASVALCLTLAVAVLAACGDKKSNNDLNAYALSDELAAKEATHTGEFVFTAGEWNTVKGHSRELMFNYDFGDLVDGDKYTRAVKVSSEDAAENFETRLFAIEGDGVYWDIANNLNALSQAIGEHTEQSDIDAITNTRNKIQAAGQFTGYWSGVRGNTYATSGDLKSTTGANFFFMADKAGTYKVTIAILDLESGDIAGETTHTVKVK